MKCGSYHILYLIAVPVQIPLMTVLMRFLMKVTELYRSDKETMSVWVLNHNFGVWQNLNPTRCRYFPFQRNTYPITVLGYKYCMHSFFEIAVVIKNASCFWRNVLNVFKSCQCLLYIHPLWVSVGIWRLLFNLVFHDLFKRDNTNLKEKQQSTFSKINNNYCCPSNVTQVKNWL